YLVYRSYPARGILPHRLVLVAAQEDGRQQSAGDKDDAFLPGPDQLLAEEWSQTFWEEAETALNELLDNIQIRNNIYHRDVTDAMFRQVGSTWTIPFKEHIIRSGAVIKAVDYDLGREGYAYKDNHPARYQYATPSTPSAR